MYAAITAAEIVVLGVATGWLTIVVVDGSVRRLFPRAWAASLGVLSFWVAIVGVLAVTSSNALLALSAATALVLVAAFLRARPGLGRSRRLPPGSMSLISSVKALAHREFYVDRATRHGPIFKMAQYRHKVVCVVGLERGHRLLRDRATSIGTSPLPFTHEIAGGFLRYMDRDTHRVYAPLFRRALAKPVVGAAAPSTGAAARRELRQLAVDCSSSPTGSVAPGPYLERIVFESFMQVLFGIGPATDICDRFVSSYRALEDQPLGAPLTKDARESLIALRRLLLEQHDQFRVQASSPVCSLAELGRIDPRMPDEVCLDNILFVLKLSTANVVSLLHWLVDTVGRQPDLLPRIREEMTAVQGDGVPDLLDRVIMETLRLGQSEYLFRTITEDFEFEGFSFPRGWQIRICVWESHRDAAMFHESTQFCPGRFLERDFSSSEYSPFGWGAHTCNGVVLTTMICRAVLEALSGFEFEVTGGDPAEHGSRHWNHWRPNSALRLRLADPIELPVPAADVVRVEGALADRVAAP